MKKLKIYLTNSRSNPGKLIWRWQDYMFEDNIIKTMRDFSENEEKFFDKEEAVKYKFISHVIK